MTMAIEETRMEYAAHLHEQRAGVTLKRLREIRSRLAKLPRGSQVDGAGRVTRYGPTRASDVEHRAQLAMAAARVAIVKARSS